MTVNSITTNSPIASSTGSISLVATTGQLLIAPGSVISANGGDITLQNLDTGNNSTASIYIGANAVLHASSTVNGVG